MLYRLITIVSLTVANAIALSQIALAETVDITFSGTVPERTSISIPTIKVEPTNFSALAKSNNQYNSTTSYKINIQTSTSSHINISQPRLVSGSTPEPVGTKHTATLKFGSTVISSDVDYGNATLSAGESNLEIDVSIRSKTLAPGTYNYVVMLTSLPN